MQLVEHAAASTAYKQPRPAPATRRSAASRCCVASSAAACAAASSWAAWVALFSAAASWMFRSASLQRKATNQVAVRSLTPH